VHPNGGVMLEELRRELPRARASEEDLVAALLLAAEARHLPLPGGDGDARVAATWGMLLDLPPGAARRAWTRAIARPDLYHRLDREAEALLGGLRSRGILIAAVSNSDGTLDAELRRFGLRDRFDVVVDSTLVGVEKPDRRVYRRACEALELEPGECWFLGDGLVNDVIGPEGAGVALGVLYDRFDLYPHLTGVTRVRGLCDLFELIDRAGPDLAAGRIPSGTVGHGRG
jgi:HAD superfamily hydrolase (TIGR01549 family)